MDIGNFSKHGKFSAMFQAFPRNKVEHGKHASFSVTDPVQDMITNFYQLLIPINPALT